jgi:hypothetical protein
MRRVARVVSALWKGNEIAFRQTKQHKFRGLVRERTVPTERLPLVGEVSANFCG